MPQYRFSFGLGGKAPAPYPWTKLLVYLSLRDIARRRYHDEDLEKYTNQQHGQEKRTTYGFGLGKRADEYFDHEAEKRTSDGFEQAKRGHRTYTFGLGKRPTYGFGLGK